MTTRCARPADRPRKRLVLAAMGGAGGMVMLDQTVVAVALQPMALALGLTTAQMHWVVLVYVLSLSSFVPVGGMTTRRYGLLPTFRAGTLLFSASSAVCGFVPAGEGTEVVLCTARAVQGAGAALMLPVATTVVTAVYERHEHGRALSIYAGVAQVFFVGGPVAGALLIHNLGWRSVFWVNLPVGALILWALAKANVTNTVSDRRLHFLEPVLMTVGLACCVTGLYQSGEWGAYDVRTWALLCSGTVLLTASAWRMRSHRPPLLDLRLFGNRDYARAVAVTFLVQAAQLPALVHGTVYLRQRWDLSVLDTGIALLPLVVALAVGTAGSGFLLDRFHSVRLPVLAGLLCATAGMAGWTYLLPWSDYRWYVAPMIVAGFGLGLPIPALSAWMMDAVPARAQADASLLRQTMRQLGGVVGLAGAGAVVLAFGPRAVDAAGVGHTSATRAAFAFLSGVLALATLLSVSPMRRGA
ncbi:MFS transporter [Streptomyces solincola]|nr:MFS transporter [Streptomyces solincola]